MRNWFVTTCYYSVTYSNILAKRVRLYQMKQVIITDEEQIDEIIEEIHDEVVDGSNIYHDEKNSALSIKFKKDIGIYKIPQKKLFGMFQTYKNIKRKANCEFIIYNVITHDLDHEKDDEYMMIDIEYKPETKIIALNTSHFHLRPMICKCKVNDLKLEYRETIIF